MSITHRLSLLPQLTPTLEPLLRQVLATGTAVRDVEIRGVTPAHPDEPRAWLASSYPVRGGDWAVTGVGVVVSEISERKRAEAALQERAALLDHAHVFIRDLEGQSVFWSQGAEARYGWSAAEALGQLSHDLLQMRFPEPLKTFHARLIQQGAWEGELTHTDRDGTPLVVPSHKLVLCDLEGHPYRMLPVNNGGAPCAAAGNGAGTYDTKNDSLCTPLSGSIWSRRSSRER